MLKDVAERSGGSTYWVYPGEDYDVVSREIIARTSGPLVKNLSITGFDSTTEILGGNDLWKAEPQTFLIKNCGIAPSEIIIQGEAADGNLFHHQILLPSYETLPVAAQFWAREKLRGILDTDLSTKISLEYGVLSSTTSFVAIHEKEIPGSKPVRIDIPVAMPHGWDMGQLDQTRGFSSASNMYCLSASSGDDDEFECLFSAASSYDLGDEVLEVTTNDRSSQFPSLDFEVLNPEPEVLAEFKKFYQDLKNSSGEDTYDNNWKVMLEKLKIQVERGFADWAVESKAELFVVMSQLRGFGYNVEIPALITERPEGSPSGLTFWREAQRLLGVNVSI
jgi:hypothetical protein